MTCNVISRMDGTWHRITGSQFCTNTCRCSGSQSEHDPHRIMDHSPATEMFHQVDAVNPAIKNEGMSSSATLDQVQLRLGKKTAAREESLILGRRTMSCVLMSWCIALLMFWCLMLLDAQS